LVEETPTKRYVDAILEVAGLLKKDRLNPKGLEEIRRMEDKQIMAFADTLWEQVQEHYKRNLPSILKEIERKDKKGTQQKGIHYGLSSPILLNSESPYLFIRKAALYYDKLILEDFLEQALHVRESYTPKGLRKRVSNEIVNWVLLKPWADMGLVEYTPRLARVWKGIELAIGWLVNEDMRDEGWQCQTLRMEDFRIEGEDLIKYIETRIQATRTEDNIRRWGSVREYALKSITGGASICLCDSVFKAGLLGGGCAPTADLRYSWRLLGFWLRCRMDLVVRGGLLDRDYAEQLRAGAALLSLEIPKLGFLEGLKPSQIGKLRASDEYRFKDFRRKWTEVCGQLKRMPWDSDFQKDANQLWTEEIIPEVERIRKDLTTVKVKLATQGLISSLGITTTLVPGLTWVGLVAAILPLLVPKASIPETLKRLEEIKIDDKNDTYFLLAAEEKAIDYSRI